MRDEGVGYTDVAVRDILERLYDTPLTEDEADSHADITVALATIEKRAPLSHEALLMCAQGYTDAEIRAWAGYASMLPDALHMLRLEMNGDTEYARALRRLVRAIEDGGEA